MNLVKLLQTGILLSVGAWAVYEIYETYQDYKDDQRYLSELDRLRRNGL